MQLKIRHTLSEELALPLSYHHIIQSIIYRGLADESGYSRHMHNSGYAANNVNNVGRRYKLFNFSLLRGNYQVINGQIIFRDYVEWEIRSPDIYMMRLLESAFRKNGIHYGNQHFSDVALRLMNETVEKDSIHIRMLSPDMSVFDQIRRQRRRISTVRRRRLSRNRSMTILSENILPVMVFHRIRE